MINDLGERIVGHPLLDFLRRFKEFHEAHQVNLPINEWFFLSVFTFLFEYLLGVCIVEKLDGCGKILSISIGFRRR
jgi:hypothetical protein